MVAGAVRFLEADHEQVPRPGCQVVESGGALPRDAGAQVGCRLLHLRVAERRPLVRAAARRRRAELFDHLGGQGRRVAHRLLEIAAVNQPVGEVDAVDRPRHSALRHVEHRQPQALVRQRVQKASRSASSRYAMPAGRSGGAGANGTGHARRGLRRTGTMPEGIIREAFRAPQASRRAACAERGEVRSVPSALHRSSSGPSAPSNAIIRKRAAMPAAFVRFHGSRPLCGTQQEFCSRCAASRRSGEPRALSSPLRAAEGDQGRSP